MGKHSHRFVETYSGPTGFGFDRQTDECTTVVYLQKLADDELASTLVGRMSDEELTALFDHVTLLLQRHLSEPEYHRLFVKE